MCGITGFIETTALHSSAELTDIAAQMNNALLHRGPDDGGVWIDAEAAVALGNRRLAIIDLSPEGHQPMLSADGRYVIAFNGEIYNYRDVRHELESTHTFRGHSDTEVLLAAIARWGVAAAVQKCVGMFALAVWDRQERCLTLARDRAGEKPLYYGWLGGVFMFGSELKALRQHPQWRGEINRDALALYLHYNYIPAPYSIFHNIFKLPPGQLLTLWPQRSTEPTLTSYWSAEEMVQHGLQQPFPGDEREATDELDRLLRQAIAGQMIADVPLGVFLSGGVDSSTIAALMQAQSSQPIKTYTMGFSVSSYNEAEYAKAVAQHLHTAHTEMYVTPQEALAVIPRLPKLYDEPFADSSQIPTFLISQLARQHVTVILSGDAADELFGGYARYTWSKKLWDTFGWMPAGLRQAAAKGLAAAAPWVTGNAMEHLGNLALRQVGRGSLGGRLQQIAETLDAENPLALYERLISLWPEPTCLVRGAQAIDTRPASLVPDLIPQLMYWDLKTYLPDDILVKVDRASMGTSLETRAPFLDHRVMEFAWSLPLGMKLRAGQGKWILRQVLDRYVPRLLIERPKMGFGVPLEHWLRHELRAWAEDLLDPAAMAAEGFLDPQPIQQKWREHLAGHHHWPYHLWGVLMFQAWKREWKH